MIALDKTAYPQLSAKVQVTRSHSRMSCIGTRTPTIGDVLRSTATVRHVQDSDDVAQVLEAYNVRLHEYSSMVVSNFCERSTQVLEALANA